MWIIKIVVLALGVTVTALSAHPSPNTPVEIVADISG